jgi:DNA transposition AAA+ family ATPase
MNIKEYLEKYRICQTHFAKCYKISRPALSKYIQGAKPSPKIAAKIHKATRGEVTFQEMGYI